MKSHIHCSYSRVQTRSLWLCLSVCFSIVNIFFIHSACLDTHIISGRKKTNRMLIMTVVFEKNFSLPTINGICGVVFRTYRQHWMVRKTHNLHYPSGGHQIAHFPCGPKVFTTNYIALCWPNIYRGFHS